MSDSNAMNDVPLNAPLQGLSSNNHGPWVVVCAYIFLVVTLLSIFIKIFTRYRATNRLTANDWYIISAGLLATVQTIAITIDVSYGLGRRRDHLSQAKFDSFEKTYYAANIILVVALAASKASVTHLVIAINPTRTLIRACYASLGLLGAWTFSSIFAYAFQCDLPQPWNSEDNKCVDQMALNIGIHALNVLTDIIIIIIPFLMMQTVQVSQSKRWMVSGLFASRIIVPIFTILMLYYLRKVYKNDDPDFPWNALVPQVFAQIMLNTSIVTACIPSLKPFLADIRPGMTIVQIPEHELTASYVRHSKRGSKVPTSKTTAVSRFASKLGLSQKGTFSSSSNGSTWSDRQKQAVTDMERGYNRPNATRAEIRIENDRSDSIKGLTDDVILQTIDYKVEYEDGRGDLDTDLTDRSEDISREYTR